MNQIFRRSALMLAIVATMTLILVDQSTAQPGRYFSSNRGYYTDAYGRAYRGYPVYGNGPYVYGTRSYYNYYNRNNYQVYGAGPYGYGSAGGYAGRNYDGSFRQYQGSVYSPYGTSVYIGPFGVGLQGFGY